VRRVYPLGPVQQGSGLNITLLSHGKRLSLGAMACKEMVPDVDTIGTGFVKEIVTLKSLAHRTGTRALRKSDERRTTRKIRKK
jgi:diacylglycerol O-acyltransferase